MVGSGNDKSCSESARERRTRGRRDWDGRREVDRMSAPKVRTRSEAVRRTNACEGHELREVSASVMACMRHGKVRRARTELDLEVRSESY